jgi:mRNA interferase YafQ
MRRIKRTAQFKRDFRRAKSTPRHRNIDPLLSEILELLANDQPPPDENRDHALTGDLVGFRDCHVRPDLLLIYDNRQSDLLILIRLGSQSELFG